MRRSARDIEILEVLDPDDPSLSWDDAPKAPASPAGPPPSERWTPRRVVPLGLGAVAVIAVAIIAVTGGDDRRPAAGATTTTVRTTSPARLQPDQDGIGGQPSGAYVIDDPRVALYSADVATPLGDDGAYRLWASGGPDAPWISVQARQRGVEPAFFAQSEQRVVGGYELVSPVEDPSRTVVVATHDSWSVTVRSHAVADALLTRFLDGVVVGRGDIVDGGGVLAEYGMVPLVHDRWADDALYGRVATSVRYLDTGGGLVTLRVADGGEMALRAQVLSFFAAGDVVRDDTAHLTATLAATGESVVMWSLDGRVMSLTGTLDAAALREMSTRVRGVTRREWSDLVTGVRPDFRVGDFADIAAGTAADGSSWSAGLQLAERAGRTVFLWWWTPPDGEDISVSVLVPEDLATTSKIERIVIPGGTFVFISEPANDQGSGRATVVDGNGTVFEVSLTSPFPDQPMRAGAVLVEAPGPIQVTVSSTETGDPTRSVEVPH